MSFEKLILVLIAVNVIAGLIGKRKKRQPPPKPGREEGLPDHPPEQILHDDTDSARTEAPPRTDARTVSVEREKASAPNAADEHSLDWEEHHIERKTPPRRIPPPGDRTGASTEAGTAGAGSGTGKETGKENIKAQGRDLLTQLAKELGLEIPFPGTERDTPSSPPGLPSEASRKREEAPERTRKEKDAAAKAGRPKERMTLAAKKAAYAERSGDGGLGWLTTEEKEAAERHGMESFRSRQDTFPVERPMSLDSLPEGLSDADALRKSFVLKTILDPPLSLRRR